MTCEPGLGPHGGCMSQENEPRAREVTGEESVDGGLWRLALELAPCVFLILDREERLLYLNEKARELHGLEPDEARGSSLGDLAAREGREQLSRHIQSAFETGEAKFEARHLEKSGSTIALEATGKRIQWEGRTALLYWGENVSDRKAAEQMLDDERRQLLSIFDSIEQIIYVTDPRTHEILYVNRAFKDFLGADPVGKKCFEEFQGLDAPCDFCTNETILKNEGKPYSWEHFNASFERHYWVTDRIIRWPDDRRVRFEIALDITDKKDLEQKLAVAQRMEAIGVLAGGIAHDFNNLLTVINNYATLAIDALSETDEAHGDMVQIRNAGQRAAALTRQLLAFSRKQVLQPKVIDLNHIVSELKPLLFRLLGEDIDIEVHLGPELGHVLADPGQMEQVIVNIVVNAREAMPMGGKLTIETADVELDEEYARRHIDVSPGDYVMLSITDTGHGMDAVTRARIFEPFFTTKERGKGTGLGLATVYGIVKQSKGDIWVYSEPGAGATFKIYLPHTLPAPAQERGTRAPSVATGGSETILLVEDEDAVRVIAERILLGAGYKVLAAADPSEALRLCKQHGDEIRLLLTDVVMPKMSGRQLAGKLLAMQPELAVLYMSGYTDNAIVHHGVLDPGTHFIAKPFAAGELTRKVREILDGRKRDPEDD